MPHHILRKGWDNWSNKEAEKEALYAEYECSGPGFNPEERVAWAKQLTATEASEYTIENILGNEKHPSSYEKFLSVKIGFGRYNDYGGPNGQCARGYCVLYWRLDDGR